MAAAAEADSLFDVLGRLLYALDDSHIVCMCGGVREFQVAKDGVGLAACAEEDVRLARTSKR